MPACSICTHPERPAIDEAIVGGRALRQVATDFGLGRDAPRRHRPHVSPALKAALTRRENAGPRKAVDRIDALMERVEVILDQAEEDGRQGRTVALAAAKELRSLVELWARLTGELDERPTVQILNVATSPEWVRTRSVLLEALAPFPDAAQAVSARLLELES